MTKKFTRYPTYTYPSEGGVYSSNPVTLYRRDDVPLLGWEREQKGISTFQCLALIIFSFLAYHSFMHFMYCPPRPPKEVFWGHVEGHTCTMYATREYTAQLMTSAAPLQNQVETCMSTPLNIHGVSHFPSSCEDRGSGVMIGRWYNNLHEPACTTYWDEYNDKGCTSPGSGKRHFTHKLMNLPHGSDWQEFCATTPIHFNQMEFPGAEECFTSIWGVYGRWEVNDNSC